MVEVDCPLKFLLEEFTSESDSLVLYYHILRMQGSVYVWVGRETGEQDCLVAAIAARSGVPGTTPVSTLIGGSGQDMAATCAGRLQAKLKFPILLSLSIPEDVLVLEHVEKTILQRLS